MGAWWNDYSALTSLNDADYLPISQSNAQNTVTLATFRQFLGLCSTCLLNSDSTLAGTPANTSETTLFTYTLPASTLSTDGWFVRIFAWGKFAANANTKRVKLKIGSTTILDSTADAFSNVENIWQINAYIVRRAAGNQDVISEITSTATNTIANPKTAKGFVESTENLNSALAITITGTNGTASASDIRYEGSLILLNS